MTGFCLHRTDHLMFNNREYVPISAYAGIQRYHIILVLVHPYIRQMLGFAYFRRQLFTDDTFAPKYTVTKWYKSGHICAYIHCNKVVQIGTHLRIYALQQSDTNHTDLPIPLKRKLTTVLYVAGIVIVHSASVLSRCLQN